MARFVLLLLGFTLSVSVCHSQNDTQLKPTIVPASSFDASTDANVLREAMDLTQKCNQTAIGSILSRRSLAQRLEIAEKYKLNFGKDLANELFSSTCRSRGSMHARMSKAMVTPLPTQFSSFLDLAMFGQKTIESELTEILCGNNNAMIRDIAQAYTDEYKKSLLTDLEGKTTGGLERLLALLVLANRNESSQVDSQRFSDDVLAQFNGGKVNWHDGPGRLNHVLALRSFPHIRRVFLELSRKTGKDIKALIEEQFSSGTKDGYVACVRIIQEPQEYFADVLKQTLEGFLGSGDPTIARVALTRSEIDLGTIKEKYKQKYGRAVIDVIHEDSSGAYKDLLTAFFG
ncbi:annexin B9-like [Cloeon dipterum]|uniref:annexin B9-like n=1 Tax=Cloeon dipterum TaxID=197152 RepID=UPI00321FA896